MGDLLKEQKVMHRYGLMHCLWMVGAFAASMAPGLAAGADASGGEQADGPGGIALEDIIVLRMAKYVYTLNLDPEGPRLLAVAGRNTLSEERPFALIGSFSEEGVAPVRGFVEDPEGILQSGYGMVNRAGEFVVPPTLRWMSVGDDGFVYVSDGRRQGGILNGTGEWVIEVGEYESVGWFSEGLCSFEAANGRWGFVDETGEVVIEPVLESRIVPSFREGLCLLDGGFAERSLLREYAFVDRQLEVVIELTSADVAPFHDGRARVVVEKEWEGPAPEGLGFMPLSTRRVGFIDRTGRFAIEPEWGTAGGFSEGRAPVVRLHIGTVRGPLWRFAPWDTAEQHIPHEPEDRLWGFIDVDGELAIEPRFERVGPFSEGLAPFRQGDLWGFIDRDGQVVIEPQFHDTDSFREGFCAVHIGDDQLALIDRNGNIVLELGLLQRISF